MTTDGKPQILSSEDSAFWRHGYIDAFIDTGEDHYHKHIATLQQFSDGIHYTGYLWDCLNSYKRITLQRFRHEVACYENVLVLADDHSRDRIPGAPLWPFRPYTVIQLKPCSLLQSLDFLPEDLYVFDSSLSWTLIRTHEDDGKRRICYSIGIEK